jgi:hypothetical protein
MVFRIVPLLAYVLSCAPTPVPRARVVPAWRGHPWCLPPGPQFVDPVNSSDFQLRFVYDTGPSWWTDLRKECPVWADALLIAQYMAGCSPDWVADPARRCQAAIRQCSPGCDICQNLKPGEGPDAEFQSLTQPRQGTKYAGTGGPYLCGGFTTRFDRRFACRDATQLAKIMVHESTHACRGAGGSKTLLTATTLSNLGRPDATRM